MPNGNAIIGQSGGPTSVINASLVGIINAAGDFDGIERILGMRFGIEGFMAGSIIDLAKESAETLEALKYTPSSALGSCRHKLNRSELPAVLDRLKENNIRYIFLIGGNDTMDTITRIEAYAKKQCYDLTGIGVPKTVDNDLFGTDHTPGFPSAARYVAISVMQEGVLARDMQKVDRFVVYQSIGWRRNLLRRRNTGFRSPYGRQIRQCRIRRYGRSKRSYDTAPNDFERVWLPGRIPDYRITADVCSRQGRAIGHRRGIYVWTGGSRIGKAGQDWPYGNTGKRSRRRIQMYHRQYSFRRSRN